MALLTTIALLANNLVIYIIIFFRKI